MLLNLFPFKKICTAIVKPYKFYVLLFLVGCIGSLWMISGTLPYLLNFTLLHMPNRGFIAFVFILAWALTLLLGSALGTSSIIGVLLVNIANLQGISIAWVTGAIISGIYLGERTSPLSSCAHLVADLTGISLKSYLLNSWKNIFPLACFVGTVFLLLSPIAPESIVTHLMVRGLSRTFQLSLWTLVPIVALCGGLILKRSFITSILLSLLAASLIALLVQHYTPFDILNTALTGYKPTHSLIALNTSGGFGMCRGIIMIAIASGLLEYAKHLDLFHHLHRLLEKMALKKGRFSATLLSSLLGSSVGFSQTVAIFITFELIENQYGTDQNERLRLALDIGNSAVLMPGLIPWNIAAAGPALLFSVEPYFMPHALLLWLAPFTSWILSRISSSKYPYCLSQSD